jgi:hypothetical protein
MIVSAPWPLRPTSCAHCRFLERNLRGLCEAVTNSPHTFEIAGAFPGKHRKFLRGREIQNGRKQKSPRKKLKSGGSDPTFSAFAAQKVSWDRLPPCTLVACRFFSQLSRTKHFVMQFVADPEG